MDREALLIDARGMRCPWPALRLARAMRETMIVELLSDDPRAAEEAQALADHNGWALTVRRDGAVAHIRAERCGARP